MSNQEREAFKAKFRPRYDVREILELGKFTDNITEHMWIGFQAGAAYQREQDKGLVDALEAAFDCGMVPTSTAKDGGVTRHARQVVVADMLRDALATYRAAQEGKV